MSGHGHVTPNPDGSKARCGGPALCGVCARELAVGRTVDRKQTCPRRMNEYGPWKRTEGLDEWRADRGLAGQNHVGLSCSFCGSLHPDRFMELLRDGWVLGPTDKRYKAYLGKPLSADEIAARKARWLDGDSIVRAIRELGERDGKTPEQIGADLECEWTERQIPGLGSGQEAKFYYQHLSEAQKREFIDLHNAHRLTVGYPGSLYVLPFFCCEHAGDAE